MKFSGLWVGSGACFGVAALKFGAADVNAVPPACALLILVGGVLAFAAACFEASNR